MQPDPSITLNPVASAPHLVLSFLVLAVAIGWAAWKSAARAGVGVRVLILACRLLLVAILLALALNPGRWVENRPVREAAGWGQVALVAGIGVEISQRFVDAAVTARQNRI